MSPLVFALQMENAVVLPHIASTTHKTRERMAQIATQNILVVFDGLPPPYCVNPEVGKNSH